MNGIFAIEKPSGITSSQFLSKLQRVLTSSEIFQKEIQAARNVRIEQYKRENKGKHPPNRILNRVSKVKMGHGGTLDPLASGVLVVGIGQGTKELANYLQGTVKCYEAEALLGLSTTSGDCEPNGEIISVNKTEHLQNLSQDAKTKLENDLVQKFKGHLKQTPPIFAALKMNGKPLHEYARQGLPLPKPIEPRQVQLYDLEFVKDDFLTTDHKYTFLQITDETVKDLSKLSNNPTTTQLYYADEYCTANGLPVGEPIKEGTLQKNFISDPSDEELVNMKSPEYKAPLFHFIAKVSSGTYIRSLIDDMGKALGSSAYMVSLKRLSQQNWDLAKGNVFKIEDFENKPERVWSAVLKKVLDEGSNIDVQKELQNEQDTYSAARKEEKLESDKAENTEESQDEKEKENQQEDNEPPTKKLKV
ncbi:hypothetical protein ACO0QE_000290 [Hanseniaspora vineae]